MYTKSILPMCCEGYAATSVSAIFLGDRRSVYTRSVLPVVALPLPYGVTAICVICVSTIAVACAQIVKTVKYTAAVPFGPKIIP